MPKDEIPIRSCCGRDMNPVRRPTVHGLRLMWTCDICNHRTPMNKEERKYYQRLIGV